MSLPILYHSGLEVSKIEKTYQKTIAQLAAGDFKSADVRKMMSTGYYRARLDIRDRLLFSIISYRNQKHILLLEVIKDHNYRGSRFLRGAELPDNEQLLPLTDLLQIKEEQIAELKYINPKNPQLHLLNKYLSFDDVQRSVLGLPTPLIIIGSAGSGKTALVLEKLKTLPGNVAYISQSKYLVENANTLYYANGYDNDRQEVEFLSLNDYLASWEKPKGKEVDFRAFEPWFNRHAQAIKINEPYRVFEEFKGVITGTDLEVPYISKDKYLLLGIKQSVFDLPEREKLYPLFLKYLDWLKENHYYDSNITCYETLRKVRPRHDYIMVDEVQDLTAIQLNCVLASLTNKQNFILTGDSNQIVHPNFFSWSKVKSYFHGLSDTDQQISILQTNYRNSHQVVSLSNYLLKIRNVRFGSIDRESTYLVNTISGDKGEVLLYQDKEKTKKELNQKTQQSTRYAVIVTDNRYKEEARNFFKTPLVFSVQEAKGLEYENVILMNLVSRHAAEFKEIIQGVDKEELLSDELHYSRGADKHDKAGEIYKFYINSFYVAITRAVKNIYLFEQNIAHPIFELTGLKEAVKELSLKEEKSSKDDWLLEADRLEEQGKLEQAEQIRAKYLGYEYMDAEMLEKICRLALDPYKKEAEVKKERKQLFQYATTHNRLDWVQALADRQFPRAVAHMKEIRAVRKDFVKNVKSGRLSTVESIINKYGIGFTTEEGYNALMLGLFYGQDNIILELLRRKSSLLATDNLGWWPVSHLLSGYFKTNLQKQQYLATEGTLVRFWELVRPSGVTMFSAHKNTYIGGHSMLFFLIILMQTMEKSRPTVTLRKEDTNQNEQDEKVGYYSMDVLYQLINLIPDEVLPPYRKKRPYINSILASHEVSRYDQPNCKLVFIRVGRGLYIIHPENKWTL